MFPSIEIQVKMPEQLMSLIIFNFENPDIWVPNLNFLQLFEI